uniref:3-oxo-5alpha-steroid 4-dehydrogenase (NADP(+)) n=1 Tax=Panagrellus redivivus TaxID=6233 RepID=A0A7E4VXC6_PANRE
MLKFLMRWSGATGDEATIFEWLAAAGQENIIIFFSQIMIIVGIGVFLALTFYRASYGRYWNEAWFSEYAINARVAWFFQELPSLLFAMAALYMYGSELTIPRFIAFIMFAGHYYQRSMIYPFLINGGKKTAPHLFLSALAFCSYNGYIQAFYHVKFANFAPTHAFNIFSQIGIVLFLTGLIINIHSDSILRNLRQPGETGYKIPYGGMFEYVSAANFFGEILEWFGYALYCQTWPAVAFALFTLCNLGPRASQHHQYYVKKFDNYPKDRRILIPLFY